MARDRSGSVAAALPIVGGVVLVAVLETSSTVLGLFELRTPIRILVIVAVALGGLGLALREREVRESLTWTCLSLGCVALLTGVGFGFLRGFEVLSVDEQLRELRQRESRSGRTVHEFAAANFRGGESDSRLFLFQERGFWANVFRSGPPVPSDEIRIYDVSDGELKEAFRFQPDGSPTAIFQFRYLGDVDNDGDAELIAGYGRPREYAQALLPLVVFWDDLETRYRIEPLQTEPPDRFAVTAPHKNASELRAAYREPSTFADESEGHRVTGYRVQDFSVVERPSPRLVSGLVLARRTPSRPGVVELAVNQIRPLDAALSIVPCSFRDKRPLTATWSVDRALWAVLAEAWQAARRSECRPVFAAG